MASPTRTLTVNFVGRTKNLERSFKRVSKGSALMSDNMIRSTRMAGLGFGALAGVAIGAAAALKPMIDKAAAMEEALSKNQLLLGESSKAVEQFAQTSLESFGVTNLAALQATGVFASLGDAMGMSEEASASMATTLTGLAGDLSSLHDVSVETALTALRAGLIGEAEPLRKLGILLDAATIKSKALTMGLVENTKEALTPAIKSQAAYALILEKGRIAMGDFARTSDSATNATKVLAGQWEEMQIVIGTALLPAFTALVTHLVDVVMPAITDFFEDPSWEGGALLAGQAAMNGFVKGFAGFTLALAGAIISPLGFVLGLVVDQFDLFGEDAGQETGTAFQRGLAAAAEQFGPLNPDWDRGDWETAGTAAGGAFYGAAGAMAPGPGFPPFADPAAPAAAAVGPTAAQLAAAAAAAAPAAAVGPTAAQLAAEAAAATAAAAPAAAAVGPTAAQLAAEAAATVGPTAAQLAAAAAAATAAATPAAAAAATPAPAAAAATVGPTAAQLAATAAAPAVAAAETDLEKFLKIVGTTDWDNFLAAQAKPTTTIVIQATAVTGQEVVDAMGAYVDTNGPLPPHWQQSAN